MLEIAGVLSNTERQAQMRIAIDHGFPFLEKRGAFHDAKAQIVCYGPSLLDTWRMIQPEGTKITVSAAHDFLADRGIQPTIHVEIDPRPHKPKMLRNPRHSTRYVMASCCHPDFWTRLKGHEVTLWHLINGSDHETEEWIKTNHPEGLNSMIGGGSTVGQRAMNVAAALGYRRFDIFGMDCSFTDARHAGPHSGIPQTVTHASVNGRTFLTTPQLVQSAREMGRFLQTMDVDVNFYGDGLMQELARLIHKRKAKQ